MLPPFAYVRPRSLDEAVNQLADNGARLHAGGTDLLGCLRDGVFGADTLVSLSDIEGLRGVRTEDDGTLVIGALTTVGALAADADIRRRYPVLAEAAAEVASPQLRHQGTLGGNLCQKPRCWYYRGDFPCLRKGGDHCFAVKGDNRYHAILGGEGCHIVHPSDTAPALVALDAGLDVAGPRGRRRLAVAELHVAPADDPMRETWLERGEVVTAVRIPPHADGLYSRYRKIRTRRSWDFAIAGCALTLTMDGDTVDDCRIVLAAAAPVPWRSQAAEEELRGGPLDDESIGAAARAAMAEAEPLRDNAYKLPLFEGMLTEELDRARETLT